MYAHFYVFIFFLILPHSGHCILILIFRLSSFFLLFLSFVLPLLLLELSLPLYPLSNSFVDVRVNASHDIEHRFNQSIYTSVTDKRLQIAVQKKMTTTSARHRANSVKFDVNKKSNNRTQQTNKMVIILGSLSFTSGAR